MCGRCHECGEVLAPFPDARGEEWCASCPEDGKRKGVYRRDATHGYLGPDADTSPWPLLSESMGRDC